MSPGKSNHTPASNPNRRAGARPRPRDKMPVFPGGCHPREHRSKSKSDIKATS